MRAGISNTLLLFCLWTVRTEDVSSTNVITNILDAFKNGNAMDMSKLLSSFRMPPCLQNCLPERIRMDVFQSNKTFLDPQILKEMCSLSEIERSADCAVVKGCSHVFVDAAANAFKLFCAQNVEDSDFTKSIECLERASEDLQQECDAHCGVHREIVDKLSKNKIEQNINIENLCNSTVCLMSCFKKRLDTRCKGHVALFDNLFNSLLNGEDKSWNSRLSWILPETCRNVTIPKDLSIKGIEYVGGKKGNGIGSVIEKAMQSMKSLELKNIDSVVTKSLNKNNDLSSRSIMVEDQKFSNNSTEPGEMTLMIDGKVQTIQWRLFDWNHQPVKTPDFETLAKIMASQLLPFSLPKERPTSVHVPSESQFKEAEHRVEKRLKTEELVEKKKLKTMTKSLNNTVADVVADGVADVVPEVAPVDVPTEATEVPKEPMWNGDRSNMVVPLNCVGVTTGIVIFVVSIGIWLFEVFQD